MASQAILPTTLNQRADQNFSRYEYLRMRGHLDHCTQVADNEALYLGHVRGQRGQWGAQDRALVLAANRSPIEFNEVANIVDTAIGYQIANRADISFVPRGHGADDKTADILSKVADQILDANRFHWKETDMFSDGMIDSRGYLDLRMCFDDNIGGEAEFSVVDTCDVMPDADSNEYEDDKWSDVTITRWYTADQMAQYYGQAKADGVTKYGVDRTAYDDWTAERKRARFGNDLTADTWYDSTKQDVDTTRYRLIDRQYYVYEKCNVAVYVETGDVKVVEGMEKEELDRIFSVPGVIRSKRMMRRVKWLITSANVVLFDDYSWYPFFTITPFFPYFRKGKTRSMVDRARWPQNLVNKSLSTGLAIFNHMAKGVWQGEPTNLDGMTMDQFKEEVSKPGASIPLKDGSKPFVQSAAPAMPGAISEFIKLGLDALRSTTGVSGELNAEGTEDMSGVAIQARQYAAQKKLAIPLDNLARTRTRIATKLLWMIQTYYTGPRVFRITEIDETTGEEQTTPLAVNQENPDGSILNDLTIGTYDIVVGEQPIAITFDNTQYEQLKEMKVDMEYPIPPEWVIRYSNVRDKSALTKAVQKAQQDAASAPPDPETQSKIAVNQAKTAQSQSQTQLIASQIKNMDADTVQKLIVAIYSSTQAAGEVAALPQVAGIADNILGSAGFKDQDAAPIISPAGVPSAGVPAIAQGAGLAQTAPPVPTVPPQPNTNTDPLTPAGPASPRIGADRGIEKPGVQ